MLKPANHYETLKVPLDAAPGRIRSAYKHLAREYHPDRNQDSLESHGLMQALNAAFEVLSDPDRRADYDEWLQRFGNTASGPASAMDKVRTWMRSQQPWLDNFAHVIKPVRQITTARWISRIGFVLLVLWALNLDREPTLHADTASPAHPAPDATNSTAEESVFQRPLRAPNGAAWPVRAAEVDGYPVSLNDGKSVVTVDNSRGLSDVFVKLVHIDEQGIETVRHIFIPARSTYACLNVRRGKYEVKYRDLESGLAARTGTFDLIETFDDRAIHSSAVRITLARITETRPEGLRISDEEFSTD